MRTALILVLILTAAGATTAWAQGNPRDFERAGPRAERQLYYAQVRIEINEVLIRWQRAWESDDAPRLARLYGEEAYFFPPSSQPAQTRAAIRDYFASNLPMVGDVEVRIMDFGTSGDFAYVTNRVSYHTSQASGAARQVVRTDMLVLRRRANQWEIQTHLAREEPAARPTGNLTP